VQHGLTARPVHVQVHQALIRLVRQPVQGERHDRGDGDGKSHGDRREIAYRPSPTHVSILSDVGH
jgi:hypothetical protein